MFQSVNGKACLTYSMFSVSKFRHYLPPVSLSVARVTQYFLAGQQCTVARTKIKRERLALE